MVLQDDAGHRAALAHSGAITYQEAGTLPAGKQDLMLLWGGRGQSGPTQGWRVAGPAPWAPAHLAGVGDGLELQGRQSGAVRGGQGQGVGDVRRRHAGERASLHYTVRVLPPELGCVTGMGRVVRSRLEGAHAQPEPTGAGALRVLWGSGLLTLGGHIVCVGLCVAQLLSFFLLSLLLLLWLRL